MLYLYGGLLSLQCCSADQVIHVLLRSVQLALGPCFLQIGLLLTQMGTCMSSAMPAIEAEALGCKADSNCQSCSEWWGCTARECRAAYLTKHGILQGNTVFHLAACSRDHGVLRCLLDNVKRCSLALYAQLHPQGISSQQEMLQMLINQRNSKGQTALAVAAQHGHAVNVQLLLNEGASPWVCDRLGGRTPLHVAALHGHTSVVELLLSWQQEGQYVPSSESSTRLVDAQTTSGFTCLHHAVAGGEIATIKAILQAQPSLSAHNRWESWEHPLNYIAGTTALHVAAYHNNVAAARELLTSYVPLHDGPDPRLLRDASGKCPWQVAFARQHRRLAVLLHPRTPVATLLTPVPRLESLACSALKQHLLANLAHALHDMYCSKAGNACTNNASQHEVQVTAKLVLDNCLGDTCKDASVSGDGDHGDVCGVCFGAVPDMVVNGCKHKLCGACAYELVQRMHSSPMLCPFCRSVVRGFVGLQPM